MAASLVHGVYSEITAQNINYACSSTERGGLRQTRVGIQREGPETNACSSTERGGLRETRVVIQREGPETNACRYTERGA